MTRTAFSLSVGRSSGGSHDSRSEGVRHPSSADPSPHFKDRIRHAIANYRIRFQEPPQEGLGQRSIRIVYLGTDANGQELEVMAVELESGDLYVIHAMPLRKKYRTRYEEGR